MIFLPQWKPRLLLYFTSAAHFPVKCFPLLHVGLASAGLLKGTIKPLKQVYNPTKTTPISKSTSGLVTVFSTWQNQL